MPLSLLFLPHLPQVFSQYFSSADISAFCTNGNADSNPPLLSPGNSTISLISSLKPHNYLSNYYNSKDYTLSSSDKLSYSQDLLPYAFFFYLGAFSLLLWLIFVSCILCKCCFCLAGPATEVQTRRRLLLPPLLMSLFLVGILVFSPFSIYYVNQLQGTLGYLVCVAARWSGGYYYGYSNWEGIYTINNATTQLLSYVNSTSADINQTLDAYNDLGISKVSAEIEELLADFVSNWSDTQPILNSNYLTYTEALPQYYQCQLCKDIVQYNAKLTSDLAVLLTPLSQNISLAITEIYAELIDLTANLTLLVESQYSWTAKLTGLYNAYDSSNMPSVDSLNSLKAGLYSYTITLLALVIVVMGLQAFAGNMVYLKRYRWRVILHVGWCCHSLFTVFCKLYAVFLVAGVLFIGSLVLSEGCTIFAEIIQEGDLGNVFVRRYLEI